MVPTKISRIPPVFAASACAVLVSACGAGTTPATSPSSLPSPDPPSSSPAAGTGTLPSTTASASVSVVPPADGLCKAGDVDLALGKGDAAAGSVYRPLLITNVSGHPCTVQGFPGVSYVAGDDGHQVGEAAYREGTEGAPVPLRTGQTAAATVRFVNVHNYDPADCRPTPVRGLRVYLPQETASKFVPMAGTGCASTDIPGHQLSVKSVRPA